MLELVETHIICFRLDKQNKNKTKETSRKPLEHIAFKHHAGQFEVSLHLVKSALVGV